MEVRLINDADTGVSVATKLNIEDMGSITGTDPEGDSTDSIYRKAAELVQQGVSLAECFTLCKEANAASNNPINFNDLTKIVKSMYGYETESVTKLVEKLNKKHAVVNIGGKCRVMNEIIDPDTGMPDLLFSSPADFRAFYSNRKVTASSGQDMTLGVVWFSNAKRREYSGITFNPKETPKGYYNLWTGFAVEPKEGECSRFLEHVLVNISKGNKAVYDYILAWMAHGVQHPDVLIGTAVVLRGSGVTLCAGDSGAE
jgi:hypothetical protein